MIVKKTDALSGADVELRETDESWGERVGPTVVASGVGGGRNERRIRGGHNLC